MKPLVFALDAQSRVDAEDERNGHCIMAYTSLFHYSWRPNFVIILRTRLEPAMWRIVMSSVACLE